jgi:hypothetical protein
VTSHRSAKWFFNRLNRNAVAQNNPTASRKEVQNILKLAYVRPHFIATRHPLMRGLCWLSTVALTAPVSLLHPPFVDPCFCVCRWTTVDQGRYLGEAERIKVREGARRGRRGSEAGEEGR